MTHLFRPHSERGSTTTELALLSAVLIIALASAGYLYIPGFAAGVLGLGEDVKTMLSSATSGGSSGSGGSNGGMGMPSGGGGPDYGGSYGGDYGGGYPSGGAPSDAGGGDDGSGGDDSGEGEPGDDSGGDDEPDDPEECPYVYDEGSDRWRDPETGQYVSGSDASAAGC